ncbi:FecR domain-containing protein [Pusillimonas sp. SM2304]|uniref:FecR domain-containing protein n=1 Tax=Pusillimonas sp. SM2304 TaxID=3073241 RepID=UPI0028762A55|nr:FecR domain-containing protein [Pusillimonas sp. SM2304]MDS1140423.1 FecR domain-containing protein [Pusillimonas sp. SM2304]
MDKPLSPAAPGASPAQQPPIDTAIVHKAAHWMARLWADDAGEADHAACRAWRAAHPDHERAWLRLQGFDNKLQEVPQHAATVLLEPAAKAALSRRRALQALGLAAVTAATLPVVYNSEAWQRVSADYSTRTGEIREIVLPDGTRILLNTASAINVRFDDAAREVALRAGEILITTGHDPAESGRPFMVRSRQGLVRALGTRFTVRQDEDVSHVAVYDGAVDILPAHALAPPLRLDAGQRSSFSDDLAQPALATLESESAWSQGLLVAENMRVQDFLHELGRYRTGLLRCSPDVADLTVTGVFPVTDTDRALANLKLALPVALTYRTRYWVTVHAR